MHRVLQSPDFSLSRTYAEPISELSALGGGQVTQLTFRLPQGILSAAPWDKINQADLAVSIATSLALTYADGAYSKESLSRNSSKARPNSQSAKELDLVITNLVKQTFIALNGQPSAFPSVDSVVNDYRKNGTQVKADWVTGRQLTVALWKDGFPKIQATLLFGTDGDTTMSIPGVFSTPAGLKSMISDYSIGQSKS